MAINSNIPLMGQQPDYSQIPQNILNTASGIQQYQSNQALLGQRAQEAPLRMQALQAQAEGAEQANVAGRQQQLNDEQKSLIQGFAQLKPLLDAGDVDGARNYLLDRKASLERVGLNTKDTDIGLQMLETNPAELKKRADINVQLGYQTGVLKAPDAQRGYAPSSLGKLMAERDLLPVGSPERAQYDRVIESQGRSLQGAPEDPAAVREFEYYQRLSPEARAEWDRSRRGDKASTATEKEIFSAVDGAQQASVQYENYTDLARRYEQSPNLASGAAGSVAEWLKEQTGTQDAASLLRKDWAAVKASEVVKNLPPGAASDADVKMALAGFLPNNANPKAVASFLRGTAKLAKINGEFQSFKADYLSENKSPAGLLSAWRKQAKTTGSTLSSGNQQKVGRFTIEAE